MTAINMTGYVRFALYFKGDTKTIESGRMVPDEDGKMVVEKREVHTGKTCIYGEWCGGSFHPVQQYSKIVKGAIRMEVHRKEINGAITVLWWDLEPEKIKFEWLAFSGVGSAEQVAAGIQLPTFIRGARITSEKHGTKEFIVVEGVI